MNNVYPLDDWQARFGDWEGSIQDLCDLSAALQVDLFPGSGSDPEEPLPNVRLLRHYLAIGLLTRGERRGREGVFGLRQLLEYLAARALLRDGWPLAKIAAFAARASDVDLAALLPEPPAQKAVARRVATHAQDLVSRFRAATGAPKAATAEPAVDRTGWDADLPMFSRKQAGTSASQAKDLVVARLATHTRERVASHTRPPGHAEPRGAATVRRTLTIDLAPGCQVAVDESVLLQLDEKGLQVLIERLRRALRAALRNQGDHDATS